jgi:hypothetical protein
MSDEQKKNPDEPAVIHAVVGPYAGQRLTMSAADAAAAIAEKWAVDPFAPPLSKEEEEKQAKEAKPMTEEERAEIQAKAEKAARKLRGEPEPEEPAKEAAATPEPPKPPPPPPPEPPPPPRQETATRDLSADKPATRYPTRDLGRK